MTPHSPALVGKNAKEGATTQSFYVWFPLQTIIKTEKGPLPKIKRKQYGNPLKKGNYQKSRLSQKRGISAENPRVHIPKCRLLWDAEGVWFFRVSPNSNDTNCSAWSRLKNRFGHHHISRAAPPTHPPQTFRPLPGLLGGWDLVCWLYSQI